MKFTRSSFCHPHISEASTATGTYHLVLGNMSVSIPHKLSWRQITTHICEWHHVQYFPLVSNLIPAMFEQATATSGTTPVIDGIIGAPARAGAHHAGRPHLWQVLTLQFGPSFLVFQCLNLNIMEKCKAMHVNYTSIYAMPCASAAFWMTSLVSSPPPRCECRSQSLQGSLHSALPSWPNPLWPLFTACPGYIICLAI